MARSFVAGRPLVMPARARSCARNPAKLAREQLLKMRARNFAIQGMERGPGGLRAGSYSRGNGGGTAAAASATESGAGWYCGRSCLCAQPYMRWPIRIFFNAPRVVRTVVTPPRRAYRERGRVYEAEEVDESEANKAVDREDDSEYSEPVRVAYYPDRTRRAAPPRAERAQPTDEDDDEDEGPRRAAAAENFENRGGARPMVNGSRATPAQWCGARTGARAAKREECDLGREFAPTQALHLGRRPRFLLRSRL